MTKKKIIFTILYFLFFATTVAFIVIMSIYGPYLKNFNKPPELIQPDSSIGELNGKINDLTEENNDLKIQLENLTNELQLKNNEIKILESKLLNADSEKKSLVAQIEKLTSDCNLLNSQIKNLELEIEAYEAYKKSTLKFTFFVDNELYSTAVVYYKSPYRFELKTPDDKLNSTFVGWKVGSASELYNFDEYGCFASGVSFTKDTRFDAVFEDRDMTREYFPEILNKRLDSPTSVVLESESSICHPSIIFKGNYADYIVRNDNIEKFIRRMLITSVSIDNDNSFIIQVSYSQLTSDSSNVTLTERYRLVKNCSCDKYLNNKHYHLFVLDDGPSYYLEIQNNA